MFSPYYAWARRRNGPGDPLDHCAVNVALYGPRSKRWAMTERRRGQLGRTADTLMIGSSQLRWDGNALNIEIDEVTAPFPSRIRGRIRLLPSALPEHLVRLDSAGRHRWKPIAPCARIEVRLSSPDLRWTGDAYLDSNSGDEPIEDAIARWDWSRASLREGTAVIYDVIRRNGDETALALRFDSSGEVTEFTPPPRLQLPGTGWRIARATRVEDGAGKVLRTLEDTPFYARSILESKLCGQQTTGMHESLNLDRFRSGIVQAMLPFRMPRARR